MIEAIYILELCDRFEAYLVPLDIYILRQRYNSQTFKSTYTIGREMGHSDETVRTIENRAMDLLAKCLDLEANDQDITPIRLAKSSRQPIASLICAGLSETVSAAAYTAQRGELIVFASSVGRPRDCTRDTYGEMAGASWLMVLDLPLPQPPTMASQPRAARGLSGAYSVRWRASRLLPASQVSSDNPVNDGPMQLCDPWMR